MPQPKECDELTCVLSCIAARNSYPRCSLPGETNHRSDIARVTRLRERVCTKAPEHTVNIARGKRTGFGINRPEGRHQEGDEQVRRDGLMQIGAEGPLCFGCARRVPSYQRNPEGTTQT